MKKGQLFVISGPSGTGKGTICRHLLEHADAELSVSMTTREPRQGEVHGRDYYFVTEESFLATIEEKGFLEHAENFGGRYGTPMAPVIEKLNLGIDMILEIDIQGAIQVRENFPNGVYIFILPPSMTELRKRIIGRGSETESSINIRLGKALKEISYIDKYDYCVVNNVIEEAVDRISAIMIAEHSRVGIEIKELIEEFKSEVDK